MLPLAFELKHRQTEALEAAAGRQLAPGTGIVYSRQELSRQPQGQVGSLWGLLAGRVGR